MKEMDIEEKKKGKEGTEASPFMLSADTASQRRDDRPHIVTQSEKRTLLGGRSRPLARLRPR